jgi:hypothetical protein
VTDPILPDDLANGLVDGTADISSLPTELRGVGELFAVAHQPATGAELAGMAMAAEQFSAVVSGTTSVAAAATTSGVVSMFGTRITKRAAVIVGATLLFAGTAAAAAGGVLPTPFSSSARDDTPAALTRLASTSSDAPESSESSIDQESSGSNSSEVANEPAAMDDSTSTSFPGRDFGHCTAWNNGATKNTGNPAFGDLADEAAKAGKSIDDFCVEVMAAHDAGDDTATSTEISTGSSVDDHGGKPVTSNSSGNGNGGHGADDPATSVGTPASVSNPSVSAPGTSVDSSGQNGKGQGGNGKGGNDSSTSSSNP